MPDAHEAQQTLIGLEVSLGTVPFYVRLACRDQPIRSDNHLSPDSPHRLSYYTDNRVYSLIIKLIPLPPRNGIRWNPFLRGLW